MKFPRIDWLAITFGVVFGLWLAADRYVGILPENSALPVSLLCLAAIIVLGLRNWRAAVFTLFAGMILVAAMDPVWKYTIHSQDSDVFKLAAMGFLVATPLIAVFGAVTFWRAWKRIGGVPARSESAPSVLSR